MYRHIIDTETCGLHGILVLLQWRTNYDGPVNMLNAWLEPVHRSMEAIEMFVGGHVICHNIRFDWFHLSKWYNTCLWLRDKYGPNVRPIDLPIEEMVEAEWQSQFGPCLKPAGATCTLLLCQTGKLQTLMNRKPIVVRKIPNEMRDMVRDTLEGLTQELPPILFARRKDVHAPRWDFKEIKDDETGEVDPEFSDVRLQFKPSNRLKHIAEFVLNYIPKHKTIPEVPEEFRIPKEFEKTGYMPFARLAGPKSWPDQVHGHVTHWAEDPAALEYAETDIVLLEKLFDYLDSPEPDRFGRLATQISSVRLRGFPVDLEMAAANLEEERAIVDSSPINIGSHVQVKRYLTEALDPVEALAIARSAKADILEKQMKVWVIEGEPEECCDDGCPRCDYKKVLAVGPMPVVGRIKKIQKIRQAKKKCEVYEKLLEAGGRLYASFKPIGAKSGRVSGADGFNAHGIGKFFKMRRVFTLADPGWVLSQGDYDSLEVVIAVMLYDDDALMVDVKSGKSIHGLMAVDLFNKPYEEIMLHKNDKDSDYKKAKIVVYSLLYGSTIGGIARKLNIPPNVVQDAYDKFVGKYKGVAATRKKLSERFTAICQPGGRGTEVFYKEPEVEVESYFGFKRNFSIEFVMLKKIFDLAQNIPYPWKSMKKKVKRFGTRTQMMWHACMSALFGCAANSIQGSIIRAALNHVIQSTGNHLTTSLQLDIWDMQPIGVNEFEVLPMSIHDECLAVCEDKDVDKLRRLVYTCIEKQEADIPMIAMGWLVGAESWGGKRKDDPEKELFFNDPGVEYPCGWSIEHAA